MPYGQACCKSIASGEGKKFKPDIGHKLRRDVIRPKKLPPYRYIRPTDDFDPGEQSISAAKLSPDDQIHGPTQRV